MNARARRVAQGAVVAAFATLVAALSHTVGGGAAPGVLALVLAFAFSAFVCIPLVGRSISLVRSSTAIVLAQAALHVLYSIGTPSGGLGAAAAGSAHHHSVGFVGTVAAPGGASMMHLDAAMLGAHVAAAVVTILAVRYADRAARAISSVVTHVARAIGLRLVAPVIFPRAGRVVTALTARLVAVVFAADIRRRGPPQGVAALV
ncbi:hypothetical protein MN032_00745 [Agromyces atrinae]|uniref:hypothetical protein n=1 Tax=Agromyces atrinae TaxID=592376 RepID=UPI001F569E16|nr:hypothetical protein [Agromyces atrinae]MCI2956201.1 hypothetical protein [Agromyces atrinae]